MEGSTGAPPQRVCPKCARISWATGPRCPYCTAYFRRTGGVTPWMLVAAVATVLVGVAILLVIGGKIYEDRLDDRVDQVTRDFDASLKRFQDDVRKELDARVPATGTTPEPTPFSEPTPEAEPTTSPEVTPFPTETASPGAEASPTETPREEIRP
ncbi:MAG TPA: hypothetical protein VNS09_03190 [Solirubrobacter sp.]|nr:hypothetical protein [Solirubrobacter sp.]